MQQALLYTPVLITVCIKETGKLKISIFRHLEGCHCVSKERFEHIHVMFNFLIPCLIC